jgi:hypothetical protein
VVVFCAIALLSDAAFTEGVVDEIRIGDLEGEHEQIQVLEVKLLWESVAACLSLNVGTDKDLGTDWDGLRLVVHDSGSLPDVDGLDAGDVDAELELKESEEDEGVVIIKLQLECAIVISLLGVAGTAEAEVGGDIGSIL